MDSQGDGQHNDTNLFDEYQETEKELLAIHIRKTKIKLFSIAVVIFIFDFLVIYMADAITGKTFLFVLIVPLLFAALGILAGKEPLLAMILGALIIGSLWVYMVIKYGGLAIISGWLGKIILIVLILTGFQSAIAAQQLKKQLNT